MTTLSATELSTVIALVCAVVLATACSSSTVLAQDAPHDYLIAHNRARAQVGVRPVQWDAALAKYAAGRAALCSFRPVPGAPYGENLFWAWDKVYHAADAVAWWVAEKPNYHCGSNSCAAGRICGHYTQVVWQKTKRIGCALAHCPAGPASGLTGASDPVYYFVCNYDPAGNIPGQRPYPCAQSSSGELSSNASYVK